MNVTALTKIACGHKIYRKAFLFSFKNDSLHTLPLVGPQDSQHEFQG